jgi:hypothetical protein
LVEPVQPLAALPRARLAADDRGPLPVADGEGGQQVGGAVAPVLEV